MHDSPKHPLLSVSLLCATLASVAFSIPQSAIAAPASPSDLAPIAVIDPPAIEALTESEVLLDGRGSGIPGTPPGQGLQYEWTQIGGPSIEVSSRTNATLTVRTPPEETVLSYTLTVSDVAGIPSLPAIGVITVSKRLSDFGDAPDSDNNHWGISNTAYVSSGVLGHFPTVWNGTPAGSGAGPNHRRPNVVWLGRQVTFPEKDADLLFDPDGVSNILNGGADVADQDKADDGWENPASTLFIDCRPTTLQVRITRSLLPLPTNQKLFLNVWFDGNRDGDWADVRECPQTADGLPPGLAREWIVPNYVVVPPGPSGSIVINVPTMRVPNGSPASAAWVRFTLSEIPLSTADAIPDDGRGPNPPGMYQLGETEDYLYPGNPVTNGQPGRVEISKTVVTSGPIVVGSLMTYVVELQHIGGTAPATVVMTDVLPASVTLAALPFVVVITPTAVPATANFTSPYLGAPSGRVNWAGSMSPGSMIAVNIPVRVRNCEPNGIRNIAVVKFDTGAAESGVQTGMQCDPKVPPVITVTKRLIEQTSPIDPATGGLGAQSVGFEIVVNSSPSPNTYTAVISDDLPIGLIAVAATANRGIANIVNAGQTVVWTGPVGGSLPPAIIKIYAKAKEQSIACDKGLVNKAYWTLIDGAISTAGTADQLGRVIGRGESNPVEVTFPCPDLGDAPDSTNHFSATMSAYPSVVARYPTVFDSPVGAPKGPKHTNARPMHLGARVSFEPEADQGWDTDGANNLRPPGDLKDMDKFDDGLVSMPTFSDCKATEMKVAVYVAPGAPAAVSTTVMYLNGWIDFTRDGDWEDVRECPQAGTTQLPIAREHFVIDFPVVVGAMAPGVNVIAVPTGLVAWPATLADKPAWLRLTLSEQKSNKTLTTLCPSSTPCFGDGRGYNAPFRLGETEDMLFRKEVINPNNPIPGDVTVAKRGIIRPEVQQPSAIAVDEPGVHLTDKAWQIDWIVEVDGADDSTTIVDTQDGKTLDLNKARIISPRDPASGLPTGRRLFLITQTLPITTPAGTIITNTVVVTKPTDINPDNNTSVATVTVPLPNPIIISPQPGTTCTGTMTITVRSIPGSLVTVYAGKPEDDPAGYLAQGSANADASGVAMIAITGDLDGDTIPEASIALYAIATSGATTSGHSNLVVVNIDTTLGWDPLSLTFEDETGHKVRPVDTQGRTDATDWAIRLKPFTMYTVSVHICCSDPNASVELTIPDVGVVVLTDPDGDRIFTATFTTGNRNANATDKSFKVCVTCNLVKICTDGTILIDPYGVVYDATVGVTSLIAGAQVACYVQTDANTGAYSVWPAADFGQINPQTTAADGYFSFFTPNGTFQLIVNKSGYQPYRSSEIVVAGTPVRYDVGLTPIMTAPVKHTITVDDNGFSPSSITVAPGDTVEWVNVDTSLHRTETTIAAGFNVASFNASTNWDSGALATGEGYRYTFNTKGSYFYYDPQNASNTATIIVNTPSFKVMMPMLMR